ncbi:MAG: trigger factor [Acidimicrobiales bacterium]
MKSTVEALEGNKVKVVVDIEEAEFEKDLDAAFRRLAREVKLPGFRPGKAPRKVLEARIGQSYARTEAFREALPGYYSDAVREHEVDVIAPPEIDITNGEESGPVSFDAVVEIRPAITVEGYDGLEIEVPDPAVAEADVDAAVDRLRRNSSTLETVDRPSAEGDTVVIDIETIHDGDEVAGLTADGYSYEVGSGAVVPELDEQLAGVSAGDELSFEADYPDDEVDEPLQFSITVTSVQAQVLPDLTDAWVAEDTEFDTVAELRASTRERLEGSRRDQARQARQNRIAEALAALVDDDDVPPAMVDSEVETRAEDMALRLQSQGLDLNTFLQITGQTQEQFAGELRAGAEVSARVDLALRAIAEAEGMQIVDEDVANEFEEISGQVGRSVDELMGDFRQAGRLPALRADLLKAKALEWVTERVNLVDEDGQPVPADALELPSEDETGKDDE